MSNQTAAVQRRGGSSRLPPVIEHPMAKMADRLQTPLDVRGDGRSGTAGDVMEGGRPLASEQPPVQPASAASSRRGRRSQVAASNGGGGGLRHQTIPEGVEVVHGESGRTRLPVFGVRAQDAAEAALDRARQSLDADASPAAAAGDRALLKSSNSSRLSEAQSARLELDEIEAIIKEKVRNNYYEMRKRFTANDPEQKGNVTRDALLRILVSAVGRPVSLRQLAQLFERVGIRRDAQLINFSEFYSALRDQEPGEYPNWMDPIQRQRLERNRLSAEQVHANLSERMRQRFVDLADVFPQFVDGGTGRMLKHELRSSLEKMLLPMDDDEFERLWRIYDPRDTGTVNGVSLLKKLGIAMKPAEGGGSHRDAAAKPAAKPAAAATRRPALKSEESRQRSLTIESWLKDKFREGFQALKAGFEARDPERTGLVSHDDFLAVLREHSLSLEKRHLAEFLARCAVTHTKAGVMYRDFLHRFQDRSEAGMAHKIMANPHHTKEDDTVSRTLSSIEKQLMNMFQRDFLSLLSAFQKIDRHGLNVISQEEFRAVMESRFGFELTDAQYREFVDKLPLNSDGLIRYDIFMRQFDTKGMAPSLFKSVGGNDVASESDAARDEDDELEEPYDPNKRSVSETRRCIRDLLHSRFQEVETAFYELDTFNSGRLTQEMMYQLLNRFIKPEVTRGEIRDLWKTFILGGREALDYQEFLRAFIFNPLTAAYPNAKLAPPRKGDSDLMMRSRKVNSDVNLLEDGLRAKIDYLWDQLRDEFVSMDPYGTGCISREEFQEVLKELAIQLTDYELNRLTDKFTQKSDGRVNYIELLRPFAYKKFGPKRQHMNELLSQRSPAAENGHATGQPVASAELQSLAAKLKRQLTGEWKNLRRQLMKMDPNNSGSISLAEFRSVLKLFNVILDEEESFQLMSHFDTSLSGKLPYKKVLELAKPGKRGSGAASRPPPISQRGQ
ncbi:hypothetical protein BOX15_Mlig033909g1 [Macrostomum lignano]|uniref:EF-hand domain-containing protein n=1 Tax=Macrostomum lignano TaxID=282301 RepID=A0A267DVA3_9PLAT|nr:hypothetical protein BOX15_Mlig033909g1 [Macrostomum lignano]